MVKLCIAPWNNLRGNFLKTMEKLEPDMWDFDKDGLYIDWLPRRPVENNEIDKAIKKIEKKYGKRLENFNNKTRKKSM